MRKEWVRSLTSWDLCQVIGFRCPEPGTLFVVAITDSIHQTLKVVLRRAYWAGCCGCCGGGAMDAARKAREGAAVLGAAPRS